jgi:uncharacterized membrane protein YccC
MSERARELLADTTRLDLGQSDLPGALRCTIGVLVPIVLGLGTGAVSYGIAGAIGALCAGFASFQGAYRRRVGITVLVAVGMALATLSGAFASRYGWSAVLVVAAWAFVAGMLTAVSQASLVVGLQWCVAVIVVNGITMTDRQALLWSGAVLLGGLVQTVLAVVVWPIRTYGAERRAVAAVYADLANYSAVILAGTMLGSASTALNDARQALRDPHPLGRPGRLVAFQGLVDEAERMRVDLTALANLRREAARSQQENENLDRFLAGLKAALSGLEAAISRDEEPSVGSLDPIGKSPKGPPNWLWDDSRQLTEALSGQLRSMLRLAEVSAGNPRVAAFTAYSRPVPGRRSLEEALLTMRANLSWHSGVFRHALRLSAVLALSVLIYRASGLAHGYWVALTALLVLRADFATTTVRGISRIVGTIAGAVLGGLLVGLLHPSTTGLAILFALAAGLAYVIVRVNYALFSVCVTAYVVFLLALAGQPVASTVDERLFSTLLGGAIAIVAYLAWPTWESRVIGPQLAGLLEAQADYAAAVLSCFASPPACERDRLNELRSATRLARANAELSVEKMASEPARSRKDALVGVEEARGVTAAARRVSLSLLTLQAHLPSIEAPGIEPVACFSPALISHMRQNAARLRQAIPTSPAVIGTVGRGRPRDDSSVERDYSLREAYNELAEALGEPTEISLHVLLTETDELVDAVNSTTSLLSAQ